MCRERFVRHFDPAASATRNVRAPQIETIRRRISKPVQKSCVSNVVNNSDSTLSPASLAARWRSAAPVIDPSLLFCDFGHLADEIQRLEAAGAGSLHLDVMDGHFVPNITYGLPMVETVRRLTRLPIDVHLMISNPEQYVEQFCQAGANLVWVHVEATDPPAAAPGADSQGGQPGRRGFQSADADLGHRGLSGRLRCGADDERPARDSAGRSSKPWRSTRCGSCGRRWRPKCCWRSTAG